MDMICVVCGRALRTDNNSNLRHTKTTHDECLSI